MTKVTARGPDETERVVELDPHGAVLLGRAPDPAALPPLAEAAERRLELVDLPAPSVSANHVLIWLENGALRLRDLGSKNGTWLLLPRERTVEAGDTDVVLHLAQPVGEGSADEEPATPGYGGRADYAREMAASVQGWLERQGVDSRVDVLARGDGITDFPTRIPLVTGEGLDIRLLATAHASWSRIVERVWRWVARQNGVFEAEEETRGEGLILASRAIRSAHRDVVDAAQAGARTLLLTGPSGSGKEVLAEVFHRHSGRTGPFVAVNCSMFSKELLRAELFGATAGAFTDSKQRILGAVERAQGGTLFLDEIGEMNAEVQPMLLRFLDRREFQSLGQYGRTQRADVRVVAATNRNLREEVRTGSFRPDLWYRLSVHVVDVPPLRTRWEDIVAYLSNVRTQDGKTSYYDTLSPEAVELLRAHPWDGNFRELTNFIQRLPRDARRGTIDAALCRRSLERGALRAAMPAQRVEPETEASSQPDWSRLATRATEAFVEDRGAPPQTWDEQKEWNEKYLKPLVFFHMTGAANLAVPLSESALSTLASQVAARIRADRGTAAKQLARYFERFHRG